MTHDKIDCSPHGLFRIFEAIQPDMKINSAEAHHVNIIRIYPPRRHLFKHRFTMHVTSSTIRMSNHHYLLHTQFKDSYDKLRITLPKGWEITPPAFFIIFTSPFLIPNAAGSKAVSRVSIQERIAIFLSGYLLVIYDSYPLFSTNCLL